MVIQLTKPVENVFRHAVRARAEAQNQQKLSVRHIEQTKTTQTLSAQNNSTNKVSTETTDTVRT